MSALGVISQLLGASDPERKQFDHGSLKIRENTLVIGDAIYPVSSISSINVWERKGVPLLVWILLGLGFLMLLLPSPMRYLSSFFWFLAFTSFVAYLWMRPSTRYSLAVHMNGGNTAQVASDDEAFLKAVALELYEVIELEVPSNTTFNIEQSVRIDSVTGSTVGVSGIHGDIVNNVQAAGSTPDFFPLGAGVMGAERTKAPDTLTA
jgi:hypothetical protein